MMFFSWLRYWLLELWNSAFPQHASLDEFVRLSNENEVEITTISFSLSSWGTTDDLSGVASTFYAGNVWAVIKLPNGKRVRYDAPDPFGSAGLGFDRTKYEAAYALLKRGVTKLQETLQIRCPHTRFELDDRVTATLMGELFLEQSS